MPESLAHTFRRRLDNFDGLSRLDAFANCSPNDMAIVCHLSRFHRPCTIFELFLRRFEEACKYVLNRSYSDLKLFTGFSRAAFIARKLTVSKVIISEPTPDVTNIHHGILVR